MTLRPLDAGSFAERVYDELSPLARDDAAHDWALLIYLGGLGQMFQEIEDLSRDTDAGVGWSPLLDLNRVPDKALPWLAQFVGVQIPSGLTAQQQRDRIAATDGWKRGSVGAIVGAVQQYLTGAKQVLLYERDTSAYHFEIRTRESETPVEEWAATNLVENSNLETDAAGIITGGNSTSARTAAVAAKGTYSLRVSQTAAGTFAHGYQRRNSTRIPVVAGETYSGSIYFRNANGNCQCAVRINWYDAGGALLSYSEGAVIVPANLGGGFHRAIVENALAPVGAITAVLYGIFYPPVGQAGATGLIGDMDAGQLERNSKVTTYIPTDNGTASRVAGAVNILRAITEQKPAGLQFVYNVVPDWTYDDLDASYATYDAIDAAFATYDDIDENDPI